MLMKRFAEVIVRRLAATRARFLSFSEHAPADEGRGPLVFLRPNE
jgi:hypothetical protein